MEMLLDKNQNIDVICQHKKDGSIAPMKVRLQDEDGEYQIFLIKAYKCLSRPGSFSMPNGISATSHTWQFECKIMVFNMETSIFLFYNAHDNFWRVDASPAHG